MNQETEKLIDKLAKSAVNRILLTFLLSIPPILLVMVFFPTKLNELLGFIMLAWGFNLGVLGGILIINHKLNQKENEEIKK